MKTRFLTVLLILFLITGCAANNEQALKIVLDWTPNTNHTGLYVAVEKGYFEKYGVNIEVIQPPEGSTTSLVGTGNNGAVFGISFQDTLAPAFAKTGDAAVPVTAVAALIQHNTSGLLSLEDKNIDRPAALSDHSYGTWNSPIELAIVEKIVNDDGGDFESVSLIPNEVTDSITAIQTDFDAVWVYYAWDGIAAQVQNIPTHYINFADYGEELDYYSPVLIANNAFLESEPETVKNVLQAVQEGYEFAIENPDEAAEILLKHAPELDRELVIQSQRWLKDQYKAEVSQWGYIDPQRWNALYNWLDENQLIENPIPDNYGFSNDFLPHK